MPNQYDFVNQLFTYEKGIALFAFDTTGVRFYR